MTVNMDTLKEPESNISERKNQKEKQPECSHSDDSAGKREIASVINNGPKDESNENIPSIHEKDENINDVTKTDAAKENVSVPATPCKCTLCDVIVASPHSLTQHIRQHNVNNQNNTCRICKKTLSSASSLDRHMLVHSGERPFKCRVCNMAFTTNGNMHRHMRTHGEAVGECLEAINENKEMKPRNGLKRRFSSESDSSYSNAMEIGDITQQQKEIVCPVCGKTFLCMYGLQIHMDTHPNDPIRCPDCLVTSSDYSAHIKHQCLGKETENGTNLPMGFHDLSFSEFSSDNFSLIAKAFCERSNRRPSSAFHKFECTKCNAAFPCGRALQMHEVTHGDKIGTYCSSCKCDFPNPSYLYAHQLNHRSAEHCWNEIKFNGKKNDANKDDFLVLFGLKTSKCSPEANDHQVKEEPFENMSYFVFGKNINEETPVAVEESVDINKQNTSSDFADIQSIISLTSKTPLMSCVRSSPAMASPASPPKVTSCALPESPPIADSAQASPETPSKEDDYVITKEESMQNDGLEESSCLEETPSKRQKTTAIQSKSYSCHKCKYTSLDKGTLRRHLRTHNGERPFQCTICSYAFTTKANCERHVKKCHKITSKEDISCAMRYNPNMTETKDPDTQATDTAHLETVCKYCNVDFKNPRVLRHHLRSLNNSCSQKPFLCTVCKSGFSTKNNCMRHVAKQHPHLKEKPSEAVLTTASNNNPSNQETIPLSDSGNSNFSEEPLNLSVRESASDMEMDISNKSELDSIEDIVNAAKGLVCLSEMPPPQVQPLDLVIQPLDLTTKPKKLPSNDNVESKLLYMSPVHNNVQPLYFENSCSPHADLIGSTMTSSSPILPEESPQSTLMTSYKMNNETVFANTDRPFICKYCSSGFTLKSNMERHIKRKHPEYARPTRSRNYVSTVSLSNEKSSNGLAVSTQTRNALRFVLNNKALSSSNQELIAENLTVQQENEVAVPLIAGRKLDNSDSNSPAQEAKDSEITVDLASISDVIDTANSQEFKQFLKENRTDTKTSEGIKNKAKKSTSTTSLNIEKFISRKRNSYADSPNSIACPYCKRKFPWRSSLRRHVLTHTGQKPFKCPKCPIWFTTKSNCERHFGRKHKVNNDFGNRSVPERPYKCNLCTSSTFSTQGNLRKHFYLKHWTKTGSGRYHLSEFLSSSKDTPMEHESDKEEIHLPVTSECQLLFNFRNKSCSPDNKQRAHSTSNGIFYCCYICYKKSYTREECLDHLEMCYSSHQNSAKDSVSEESNHCEKDLNLNEEFVNSGNITDSAQSKIACAFCSNVFCSREEFCLHMKAHIKKLKNMPLGTKNNEKQDIGPNDLCTSSLLSTRNTRSNSLLYLMQAGKAYNPAWNGSEWNGGQNVAQNEDDTDLIQNLLGIRDPKMLDEIFDSADSAARLLGVEEV